jgi:triosephosphate isomerase (TIM)
MRTWMVAGNWKMHNNVGEAVSLARGIRERAGDIRNVEVVLAPPFTALYSVNEVIKDSPIRLAAQNVFYEDKGAYTGEVSPLMLKDIGCAYVIIGHSERRKYFHELDQTVNLKIKKCLSTGLKLIVCVGETEEEREKGVTEFVVGIQVKRALSGIADLSDVVLAYEPVWAIGTGKTATPMEAEEVHAFIRGLLADTYRDQSQKVPILYGGSVTPENIGELIDMEDIDGALVGGASLKIETFAAIIQKVMEKR